MNKNILLFEIENEEELSKWSIKKDLLNIRLPIGTPVYFNKKDTERGTFNIFTPYCNPAGVNGDEERVKIKRKDTMHLVENEDVSSFTKEQSNFPQDHKILRIHKTLPVKDLTTIAHVSKLASSGGISIFTSTLEGTKNLKDFINWLLEESREVAIGDYTPRQAVNNSLGMLYVNVVSIIKMEDCLPIFNKVEDPNCFCVVVKTIGKVKSKEDQGVYSVQSGSFLLAREIDKVASFDGGKTHAGKCRKQNARDTLADFWVSAEKKILENTKVQERFYKKEVKERNTAKPNKTNILSGSLDTNYIIEHLEEDKIEPMVYTPKIYVYSTTYGRDLNTRATNYTSTTST